MTNMELDLLINKVENDILHSITEEHIREQLKGDGLDDIWINIALMKGKRLAECRKLLSHRGWGEVS